MGTEIVIVSGGRMEWRFGIERLVLCLAALCCML